MPIRTRIQTGVPVGLLLPQKLPIVMPIDTHILACGTHISTGVPMGLLVLQGVPTDKSTGTPILACVPIGLKVLHKLPTNISTGNPIQIFITSNCHANRYSHTNYPANGSLDTT